MPWAGRGVAQAETRYDVAITVDVLACHIVEQPPAAAHHLEETTPRVMVVLVSGEMRSQVIYARRQNSYLYFRRACIGVVYLIIADYLLLTLRLQCQLDYLLRAVRRPRWPILQGVHTSASNPLLLGGGTPSLFLLHLTLQYAAIITQSQTAGQGAF